MNDFVKNCNIINLEIFKTKINYDNVVNNFWDDFENFIKTPINRII